MQLEPGRTFLGRTSQTGLAFAGLKDHDVLLANNNDKKSSFTLMNYVQ